MTDALLIGAQVLGYVGIVAGLVLLVASSASPARSAPSPSARPSVQSPVALGRAVSSPEAAAVVAVRQLVNWAGVGRLDRRRFCAEVLRDAVEDQAAAEGITLNPSWWRP